MTRIAVARLWFEGNAFSPTLTGEAEFARREWRVGEAALAAGRGTATELGAVVDVAAARPGWSVQALRCASADPGGPIEEAVFGRWLDEVLAGLRRVAPDGVYLSLHGAAITTARDTPELDALRAVRAAVGDAVPVVASFDLHGNLDPGIAAPLDFGTVYRTYPHVDMHETATRALAALERRLGGAPRGAGAVVPLGRVLPSFNMRTEAGPMHALEALARAAEREPGVHDVSLFGGFPYADTAATGASVMAWADDGATARRVAHRLADAMVARAAEFEPRLLSAREGILHALAAAAGPVAVTDPADNPLSGGGADTPALFATLLAMRREAGGPLAVLPAGRIAFAYFADAGLVARARAAGPGAMLEATLGARHGAAFGASVPVHARVVRATEGRFANTGPMERGSVVDVGPSVVLDVEGILVVVTSAVGAANDPGFLALHGIDPAGLRLLAVKAKNHFRAAFAPLLGAIVDVDCPGPAAADLSTLPFRRAPGVGRPAR
ncbi:MAG: M81 family peptidase [Burkholderiales bacterium]|nr:MAG: M81 family peptidase [Burkholderiales bacterium]